MENEKGRGMKKLLLSVFSAAIVFTLQAWQNKDFTRSATDFVKEIEIGINIGNTLDVPSGNETEWGNAPITRDLIRLYRKKGFTAVRIPISWRNQFSRQDPESKIKLAFLLRVKEVVDWCLAEDLVTIINIHHDGGDDGWPGAWLTIDGKHEEQAKKILANLWGYIASTFQNYDERLVFEAFNEVRKAKRYAGPKCGEVGREDWTGRTEYFKVIADYAQTFYDTVRASGGYNKKRYLMIPTYAAAFQQTTVDNWYNPNPADNHLIATIHCYEPGDFCLWGNRTKYDANYVESRLNEFFPRFKRKFTDNKIPLILGEINADLRYYDSTQLIPNDDARVKWAAHYAQKARQYGFPCFIWESGGAKGMGLIDRFKTAFTHEEVVDAFTLGAKGKATPEVVEALAAKVRIDPKALWEKSDVIFKWNFDSSSFQCWGQTMGFGNLNGNGVTKRYLTVDEKGALHVNTHDAGGNMIQQQFWADQVFGAARAYRAYVETHENKAIGGKKFVITVRSAKGTAVNVKGDLIVPGLKGRLHFGADQGAQRLFSKNGEVARYEVEIPAGTKLDPKSHGLGVEVWFLTENWGSNQSLNFVIDPIEIR